MVVNDHTRSAENWKCVWYLLRLYIRVYVDSHSLGQLALASKRTASIVKCKGMFYKYIARIKSVGPLYITSLSGRVVHSE